jgi:hypothetical protein
MGKPLRTHTISAALFLFFVAPFIGEILLGDIAFGSFKVIGIYLLFSLLYGGGALLIREIARRTGRGWPTMFTLAIAYGFFEEGLVTQSLFNPSYLGNNLISATHIPVIGTGVVWLLFVVTLHAVWSISVSIALAEAFAGKARATPWLRRRGVIITSLLFIIGAISTFAGNYAPSHFFANPLQITTVCLIVALLVFVAFRLKPPSGTSSKQLPVLVVGLAGFGLTSVFMLLRLAPSSWWVAGGFFILFITSFWLIRHWVTTTKWLPSHTLALASGALMTYVWNSFLSQPLIGVRSALNTLITHIICLGVAVYLILLAAYRQNSSAKNSSVQQ